jgi:RimJ/RimL family protein N-acetyltransferase
MRSSFARGGIAALALFVACAANAPSTGPYAPSYSPPTTLDTDRIHLEPLHPSHTEMDYAAFMSSNDHLQRTLHWGDWPRSDYTLDENRADLERHWREFEAREAYAFTVQSADRSRCVGCIYVNPVSPKSFAAGATPEPNAARLAFWVIESELATDLDRHLLELTLAWLRREWSFSTVYVPLHSENERGQRIARELGLTVADNMAIDSHTTYR